MYSLRNATVVAAGASSCIGSVITLAFARRDTGLVLTARRSDALEQAAQRCLTADAVHATAVPTDIAGPATGQGAGADCGGCLRRHWHLVNAADLGHFDPFEVMSLDSGMACRVNLIGAMHGTHAILPEMPGRAGRRGSIIAKGSIGIPPSARSPVQTSAVCRGSRR